MGESNVCQSSAEKGILVKLVRSRGVYIVGQKELIQYCFCFFGENMFRPESSVPCSRSRGIKVMEKLRVI